MGEDNRGQAVTFSGITLCLVFGGLHSAVSSRVKTAEK